LRSPVPSPPPPTEFERLVTLRRPYIEAARHYVRRYGQIPAQDAILRDMRAGRLPREKGEHMLGYLLFLLVEGVCRRIGYTCYEALLKEPKFILDMAAEMDIQQRLYGSASEQWREQFAMQAARDALDTWHLVAQDLAGNLVYEVTPALGWALRHPPPHDLSCDDLRLPVPALLLIVPAEAELTLVDDAGQPHRVTEIYVIESPTPERRWYLWICAPMDERAVRTEYVNVELSAQSLESTIRATQAAHATAGRAASDWPQCVRCLAGAMRYLDAGGLSREHWFDKEVQQIHERLAQLGPNKQKQRDVLRAKLQGMCAGRRIILGAEPAHA
jgi:hypothetical protein